MGGLVHLGPLSRPSVIAGNKDIEGKGETYVADHLGEFIVAREDLQARNSVNQIRGLMRSM